jgi:hypothetical protein
MGCKISRDVACRVSTFWTASSVNFRKDDAQN